MDVELSVRQYYAGIALRALIDNNLYAYAEGGDVVDSVALGKEVVRIADGVIKELERP